MKYRNFVTLADGTEEEVIAEFDFFAGDPGRTWGRPELCYPPEGDELSITAVRNLAGDDITDTISEEELELLNVRIYDNSEDWYPQLAARDEDAEREAFYNRTGV